MKEDGKCRIFYFVLRTEKLLWDVSAFRSFLFYKDICVFLFSPECFFGAFYAQGCARKFAALQHASRAGEGKEPSLPDLEVIW